MQTNRKTQKDLTYRNNVPKEKKNTALISQFDFENDVIELLHRLGRHAGSIRKKDELIRYTVCTIREWRNDFIDHYFEN